MDEQLSIPDLLSDLPLSIIHIILSFVPIRDAIKTSFLSRQWRYIWTSLPYLVFADPHIYVQIANATDIDRQIRFISQVLLLHKGPIHKFEVNLLYMAVSRVQFQSISQWLLFKDIRILVLVLNFVDPWIEVHSSLYSCQKLTHLELFVNTIPPPPPSFKGFLFLKSLNIRTAKVDSSTIESIFAHSHLLEELTLIGNKYSEMTIRAPNLKVLRFDSTCTRLSLSTPLLEELTVNFREMKHFSFLESSVSVFHHLRIIRLFYADFNSTEVAMAVDRFITCSHNLQKLEIEIMPFLEYGASELSSVSLSDIESVADFTYDSLKVVKMEVFCCKIDAIKRIKFLLARSPVLERMIYKPGSSLSEQVLLNLTSELLSCPRASANAEIVIEKSEQDLEEYRYRLYNFY